jgi:hypothetical protein
MANETYCDFCGAELAAGREFVYQYESLNFVDDEEILRLIRSSGAYYGEPLRLCNHCNNSVLRNEREQKQEAQEEAENRKRARALFLGGLAIVAVFAWLAWYLEWFA